MDCAGLRKNLATLDVCSLDTTKKSTDVVACLSVVEELTEHFDTCNNSLLLLVGKTNDLNFVRHLELSTLNSTCSNCTTACDCEYVLNRHKERKVSLTVRSRDVAVNSIHELPDASKLRSVYVVSVILKSLKSRTLDDRCVVAREIVLVKSLTDLHLNKLDKLRIVNLVDLVHENDDVGNANLTCKKKVFLGLSHRTVCCSDNKDSTVHLSSTGDHVLDVVSMARAVNVSIVTCSSLILNVSGVDCDTTLSLFRSLIDVSVVNECSLTLHCEGLCDSSCQSSLTMVNVADSTNVDMGFGSVKFFLCHLEFPPFGIK